MRLFPRNLDEVRSDLRLTRLYGKALPALFKARPGSGYTVADLFEDRAAAHPERLALVGTDETLTYGELDAAANRVARWARAQGVGTASVVAVVMGNRPAYVATWLGLAKVGAISALINTSLTGPALARAVELAGAGHVVVDGPFADQWTAATEHLDEAPALWSRRGAVPGATDLDADLAERSGAPLGSSARSELGPEDLLFFIYTSGTTGLPKAAKFPHARFLAASAGGQAMGDWGADDRVYVPLPLFHTAGGVAAVGGAIQGGSTVVIPERFSASRFWSDCVTHGVTAFQYIGELCRYLVNAPPHPDERRHRVRVAVGNGLRPDVWPAFQERFGIERVVEFYGATEGNVALANLDGRIGAVGRLPGAVRAALGVHLLRYDVENDEVFRDAQGRGIEAEPGEAGELVGKISRTARFDGYSDDAATEAKVLRNVFADGDAYFRTGDLLRLADDGYYEFVDRIGDTFRWKGENVSTAEVAEVLGVHPDVGEANVYGVAVPGAEGRCGMAAVVADGDLDPADLGRHVTAQLPAYARPRFVRLVEGMAVTGTFKHRKVELVGDGFDPALVDDPLWLLDTATDTYVPLDAPLHRRITSGDLRL